MSDDIMETAYDSTISYISLFCMCKGQVLSKKDNTVIVCGQIRRSPFDFLCLKNGLT